MIRLFALSVIAAMLLWLLFCAVRGARTGVLVVGRGGRTTIVRSEAPVPFFAGLLVNLAAAGFGLWFVAQQVPDAIAAL